MNPYKLAEFTLQPGFESTTFTTDSGQEYYVYFQDISGFGKKIYSFGFVPVGAGMDEDFPYDRRIPDTIAYIIDQAFCEGKETIVYQPYNGDGRRLRLFDFWFARYKSSLSCGGIDRDQITFLYVIRDNFLCHVYARLQRDCRVNFKRCFSGNVGRQKLN